MNVVVSILLLEKKRALFNEIKNVQMKVFEYADVCRDLKAEKEYKEAVVINDKLMSISLRK